MRNFFLLLLNWLSSGHVGGTVDCLVFRSKNISISTFEDNKFEEITKKPGSLFHCALSCAHSKICAQFLDDGEKCHLLERFEFQQEPYDDGPYLTNSSSLVTIKDMEEWSHIMVIGGVTNILGITNDVEVLDLKTMKQCSVPTTLPESRYGAAAFILDGQINYASGIGINRQVADNLYLHFTSDTWQKADLLPSPVIHSAVAQIDKSWVLLIGGYKTQKTTIVHSNGSIIPGPPLPFHLVRHCAIGVDEEHIFIAGGVSPGLGPILDVFVLNWSDQVWVPQDRMQKKQSFMDCITFLDKNNELNILAGQKHFEIFEWSTRKWRPGPIMLNDYLWARLAKYKGIPYLIGGETPTNQTKSKHIHKFDPMAESWTKIPLNLQIGRSRFGLLKIPSGIARC